MYSLAILTITACALALLLTPLIRQASIRFGLLDRPDHIRKLHSSVLPPTGGVALLLSYAGAYGVLLLLPLKGSAIIGANLGAVWSLLPPVALVFVTGLLDDWLDLRPWHKLLGQLAAALWAYAAGVRISAVAGHVVVPWLGLLLTIAWLILCSNAFNLIDGMDGLAAGVGLTATLTTFVAGLLYGDAMLCLATAPLAGALLGFLRYNFNPASIFLGDCGSLFIGFLLGAYGVIWAQKSATLVGMASPAIVMALPLLEVGLSVVRRFLRNEPIFAGDRGHIHYRLMDLGFTTRRAALILYAVCCLLAVLSLCQTVLRNQLAALVILVFAGGACAGVRYLGYAEFQAAPRFIWICLRPILGIHVRLKSLESSLLAAKSIEQCWELLARAAQEFGYGQIEARLAGARFTSGTAREGRPAWQMRLNLIGGDYVNIAQGSGDNQPPPVLMPFIELIQRILPARLARFADPAAAERTYSAPLNSNTTRVMSSDCGAPSVNAVTAS